MFRVNSYARRSLRPSTSHRRCRCSRLTDCGEDERMGSIEGRCGARRGFWRSFPSTDPTRSEIGRCAGRREHLTHTRAFSCSACSPAGPHRALADALLRAAAILRCVSVSCAADTAAGERCRRYQPVPFACARLVALISRLVATRGDAEVVVCVPAAAARAHGQRRPRRHRLLADVARRRNRDDEPQHTECDCVCCASRAMSAPARMYIAPRCIKGVKHRN